MMDWYDKYLSLSSFFLACALLLMIHPFNFAAKKDKDKEKTVVMTEIELQSQLMSYTESTWQCGSCSFHTRIRVFSLMEEEYSQSGYKGRDFI